MLREIWKTINFPVLFVICRMLQEHEMILKVLEKASSPLKARTISKNIYTDFNGYKISRFKVRDHLWDPKTLKNLIAYDNENYTYSLQKNIDTQKNLVVNDDCVFQFSVVKKDKMHNEMREEMHKENKPTNVKKTKKPSGLINPKIIPVKNTALVLKKDICFQQIKHAYIKIDR